MSGDAAPTAGLPQGERSAAICFDFWEDLSDFLCMLCEFVFDGQEQEELQGRVKSAEAV